MRPSEISGPSALFLISEETGLLRAASSTCRGRRGAGYGSPKHGFGSADVTVPNVQNERRDIDPQGAFLSSRGAGCANSSASSARTTHCSGPGNNRSAALRTTDRLANQSRCFSSYLEGRSDGRWTGNWTGVLKRLVEIRNGTVQARCKVSAGELNCAS